MAVSYVGAGSVVTGTSLTVGVPSGYAAGDYLIIFGSSIAGGAPSGWTLIYNSNSNIYVVVKIATSSESSVSLTGNILSSSAVMLAYRNVSNVGIRSGFNTAVSTTTLATDSIAALEPNSSIISLYASTAVAGTWTAPASTTARLTSNPTASARGLLVVDETPAVPGNTTTRTATLSATATLYCISFALHDGAPTSKTIVLTSGTTWTVPSDWTDAGSTIRGIGGGGGGRKPANNTGGAAGGGGGAFAEVTELGLTAGSTVYINIGSGGAGGTTAGGQSGANGGDTWLNKTTNAAPSSATDGLLAKGGSGSTGTTGALGGSSTTSVGTFKYSGGSGGNGSGANAGRPSGAGGSAASNIGSGFAGENATTTQTHGGPGGGGVRSIGNVGGTTGGSGGDNYARAAGGSGGTAANNGTAGTLGGGGGGSGSISGSQAKVTGGAGGAGGEIAITAGGTAGSGGGGGAAGGSSSSNGGNNGGNGGLYGGGGAGGGGSDSSLRASGTGGNGGDGIIIITYNAKAANGNFFFMFQ